MSPLGRGTPHRARYAHRTDGEQGPPGDTHRCEHLTCYDVRVVNGDGDGTEHDRATAVVDAANAVSPIVAIETLRAIDRKGLGGTALTVATGIPTLLVLVIWICALAGGVGLAVAAPWLVGSVIAASALGVITVRNLRQSSARKAALAALESSRATASLSDDVLEIRANDQARPWRFALGGSSKSLRMLPPARMLGREDSR